MSNPQSSPLAQNVLVQLEVISEEDERETDIADINEVGRTLFEQLTLSGYLVKPTLTGRKGGQPLFDILLQITQFLHENKDWLLASIPPLLECLLIARDKRAEREKTKRSPLKITLIVNDKPMLVETADPKEAIKLVEQFQGTHPDKVKIQVRVPKKHRR